MEIKFKRFNPQTDIIKPFDCGDSDLNGFLLESNEDVPNATLTKRFGIVFPGRFPMQNADAHIQPSK